ncbi:COG5377 Phage-related protein, predicted endonuclease [uncultured Caudovirales phage]|jgi:putative phage-type endonuclease|uniref:COG5377 Phage-related protein, predicted endonuclease n=1 Tax=uncultured Caudovirales phage TaxID=2100421 RepID=A0A6J5KVG9_9CAUD|nr:COG5377 Phage-related protein, predicted endonuclease [uncultured Caudovirales phage]
MIQQNTPEWEALRSNKVGASDAPAIMEVSPWETPYSLWEKKLGLKESSYNSAMQRGHELEDKARIELEKILGVLLLPEVKLHDEHHWMMASLDALDSTNSVLAEIKCPGKVDHAMAASGKIPDKYFPQLQHQLEVCKLEMGYYYSFDGEAGVLLKIYRDDKYIKEMVSKEKEFWDCLQEFNPPKMTLKDYSVQFGDEWRRYAAEWEQVSEQRKALEEREDALKKALIALSQNQSSQGGGIRLTKVIRKGNVDYSAIPELKQVDLETYRKKPIESWRLSKV